MVIVATYEKSGVKQNLEGTLIILNGLLLSLGGLLLSFYFALLLMITEITLFNN